MVARRRFIIRTPKLNHQEHITGPIEDLTVGVEYAIMRTFQTRNRQLFSYKQTFAGVNMSEKQIVLQKGEWPAFSVRKYCVIFSTNSPWVNKQRYAGEVKLILHYANAAHMRSASSRAPSQSIPPPYLHSTTPHVPFYANAAPAPPPAHATPYPAPYLLPGSAPSYPPPTYIPNASSPYQPPAYPPSSSYPPQPSYPPSPYPPPAGYHPGVYPPPY